MIQFLLKLFNKTTPESNVPKFAFCESVAASSHAIWHIRTVPDGKLRLGGGINTTSLCKKVQSGWDIKCEFSEKHFSNCCAECLFIWKNFYDETS